MKPVNLTPKLNRTEKKIIEYLKNRENTTNDLMDDIAYIKKQFIKLRKDTDSLICFDEPIDF